MGDERNLITGTLARSESTFVEDYKVILTEKLDIVKAPGIDRILLAFRVLGDSNSKYRTINVKYQNDRSGTVDSVDMTVTGISHENGSGESVIVEGYAVNSMTSDGRVNGKIKFWTRDGAKNCWISIPFLV